MVAKRSPLREFDEWAVRALARRRTDGLDATIGPLSMLATQEPLTVQGAIAFAMLLITAGGSSAAYFAVVAIGSGVLSQLAKLAVRRPRPAVPHLLRWVRGSSYPSADLVTATAIYSTIALIVAPYLPDANARVVLFTMVAVLLPVLAACRVYAGVHHPSDVVAGIVLGAAWACFAAAWFGVRS